MPMGSFVANGNCVPSRFAKFDQTAGAEGKVINSTNCSDKLYGIFGEGTRYPPGFGNLDDGFHAIAGENARVYVDDEECWLEAGGVITAGDRLTSDTVARGVTIGGSNTGAIGPPCNCGAIALQNAAAAGALIRVRVEKGFQVGTSSS